MEQQNAASENTPEQLLRPVCFMIMPYNTKEVAGDKKMLVDFNALWTKVFQPLIEEDLHCTAIRADQDLGALIIKDMIERLALADIVIADISAANANVYYEIGIRHAVKKTGCVLISADWSAALFDLQQIRQLRYPLPEGAITDETATAIRNELKDKIIVQFKGSSPVYDCLPGFPGAVDKKTAESFHKYVDELMTFSTEVKTTRMQVGSARREATQQLIEKHCAAISIPAIALELLYLIRDNNDWRALVSFIEKLPAEIREMPVVKEQYSLGLSKNEDHFEAISALEVLISSYGDTSERRGLLGGRYKKLYRNTKDARYLSKAIDAYNRGMRLDLNDYYPASNLPRLLRERGNTGDEDKAKAAATVALIACERARKLNPSDEYVLPTLLGMAFDAGDISKIEELYNEMTDTGIQPFQLDTTLSDLKTAVALQKDDLIKAEMEEKLQKIAVLAD